MQVLSRNRSRPWMPSTPTRLRNKPPPPPFTSLFHVFWFFWWFFFFFSFFFIAHLTSHLPLQPEGWDQVGKSWRSSEENIPDEQASLLSPNKPSLRQFPPHRHHTQRTTQIETALQATANIQDWKECDLAFFSSSVNLPWGQIPHEHGLIIKELKEALKRHQHLTKRSHSPNHAYTWLCVPTCP